MSIVAGIDVSKGTLDVFVSGRTVQVENTVAGFKSLVRRLRSERAQLVVMEATGTYHEEAARTLVEEGFEVVVVNPARAHYYAKSLGRRIKTDKVDAETLARLGHAQGEILERYTPPTLEFRRFRSLMRMRHDVTVQLAGVKGRLKGVGLDKLERALLADQKSLFEAQIARIDAEVKEAVVQAGLAEREKLLLTIPGVGPVTARTLLAEVGDFDRFDAAKRLAAFAGVCPSFRHSGTSIGGNGSMSRAGNRTLRKLLYLAALAAIRSDNPFRATYQRMIAHGKAPMSAIVVVMHKLLRVAYGVVTKGKVFDAAKALPKAA